MDKILLLFKSFSISYISNANLSCFDKENKTSFVISFVCIIWDISVLLSILSFKKNSFKFNSSLFPTFFFLIFILIVSPSS